MIEVAPRLYVGNQLDYETKVRGDYDWRIVQACKEPYHRQALGYNGRGAPRCDAEYLYAIRDNRLILNMVDVDDHRYFDPKMIDFALDYIDEAKHSRAKVLIHCNQGGSRAPGLALHYLRHRTDTFLRGNDAEYGEMAFRNLYPNYQPANGIRDFVIAHWDD